MTLNRLLNADNECVGYFTDDAAGRAAMQAARTEWEKLCRICEGSGEDRTRPRIADGGHGFFPDCQTCRRSKVQFCRSIATPIEPLELEDVEPGDGDRVDYVLRNDCDGIVPTSLRIRGWYLRGAASVDVRRHEINRYRRPGKSHRSADLGGPEQAADVLYVLTIKAPIVQRLCK